jgi:hypothetical protein
LNRRRQGGGGGEEEHIGMTRVVRQLQRINSLSNRRGFQCHAKVALIQQSEREKERKEMSYFTFFSL